MVSKFRSVTALSSINVMPSDCAIDCISRVNADRFCASVRHTSAMRNGRFPGAHPHDMPARAQAIKIRIHDLRLILANLNRGIRA
jgi:hypothetical protein